MGSNAVETAKSKVMHIQGKIGSWDYCWGNVNGGEE